MKLRSSLPLLLLIFLSLHGFGSGQADQDQHWNPGAQVIKHVIIMMQENRSTDNLFNGLPNADTVTSGKNSKGKIIQLEPIVLANSYDLGHTHVAFRVEYDGGKMDGADRVFVSCGKGCPNAQFKYVQQSDVAPYFQMAAQYAFADHMFQSNQGESYPAHQWVIAATSAPSATSKMFVAENPDGFLHAPQNTGCTAPSYEFVRLINPLGLENQVIYPCFEHITLMDLLDNAKLSWRFYAPNLAQIWAAPNSIAHLRNGKDWQYVIGNPAQVLNDISGNQLADVTWVMPQVPSSDHPQENNGTGPSWISSVVNAVGNSQYWSSTAIFITWDDWGGWYDHVAPPIINSYQYGLRVPLLMVSPYAVPGCVSHVTHDFSSILKFTETVFNLPTMGFGDVKADDLTDCFNFSQEPLHFHKISAPLNANYFLNVKSLPTESDEY
jgi:phospholipase C